MCTFSCKNGYAFVPGSDEKCTCDDLGDWSGPPPKCIANSQRFVKGGGGDQAFWKKVARKIYARKIFCLWLHNSYPLLWVKRIGLTYLAMGHFILQFICNIIFKCEGAPQLGYVHIVLYSSQRDCCQLIGGTHITCNALVLPFRLRFTMSPIEHKQLWNGTYDLRQETCTGTLVVRIAFKCYPNYFVLSNQPLPNTFEQHRSYNCYRTWEEDCDSTTNKHSQQNIF